MFTDIKVLLYLKVGMKLFPYFNFHGQFLFVCLLQIEADLSSDIFDAKVVL